MTPKWIVLLVLACAAPVAFAQTDRATVLGTVTDDTGSVIPAAAVTVTNVGTQEKRVATTNERGDYDVPSLNIGEYEVSVEHAGFRKEVVKGIVLVVNQKARVDVKLQIGAVTQEVMVQGAAPLIHTDDATIGQLIDERKITELPIPGKRNMYLLALLGAGMSRGPASSVTTSGFGPGFGIAAMGQKVHNNWIMLDGAPLRTSIHAAVRMRPSVEALQEFKVEAGFYSAEFGTQSGAQIVSAIRPGGNQFHGTLFEFLRNEKLDARNFFENPLIPKRPLRRNNFGGVVSGRIIRDKLFFTANHESFIERRSSQGSAVYPTKRMMSGDLTEPFFHSNRDPNGPLTPIRDLLSGQPFPNNLIPASRIAPQAQKLFQFWPAPNFGSALFDGATNYGGQSRSTVDDRQVFLRMDYNLDQKNRLFGRYGFQDITEFAGDLNPHPFFGQDRPKRQQNATLTYTRLLSATKLNELTVSYNRDIFQTLDRVSGQDFNIARDLLIPGQTSDPFTTGVPSISITGVSGIGNTVPNTIWDESRRVSDTFSFSHGRHSMKLGSEFFHVLLRRETYQFVTGNFIFTGIHSGQGLTTAARESTAWADFLLDQPSQARTAYSEVPGFKPGQFTRLFAWRSHTFFTDDWKATPRLTVNLGLRYEYNSVLRDIRGGTRNFDFRTQDLFPAPGVSAPLYKPDYNNFAPRIGLAFRPFNDNKTVVRASYGVFYNVNMLNNLTESSKNIPFSAGINELNNPGQIRIRMSSAVVGGNIAATQAREVLAVPDNYGVGDAQQWTLNIQRSLKKDILFEIGYVGSKSSHFDRPRTFNAINILKGETRKPYPQWGNIELITTDASGSYHGLLLKGEKRFSQGLTFLATYTWSKTFFDSFAGNGADRHNSPFDLKSEKGLAETDQRHRATASWLYELPFFRSRKDLLGKIAGGWQTNGVFNLETGMPFYPVQSIQPLADECSRCTRRPDRIADGNLPGSQRTLRRWFDISAFTLAVGHYGTAGRNILTAPGLTSIDFSLFKNFHITESKNLQFRWEAYNATNTPPFNPPNRSIGTGTFGAVTSAGLGREMQFGLRLEF
ncbi:MAG: TonB-dependent receptor [Acidobacteria bacterium]|nr:TonB-dependent receptor [Acidobacteriota bacterium]